MRWTNRVRWLPVVPLLLGLTLVAVACGGNAGAATAGDLSLHITAPTAGAKVAEPFMVRVDSSVPLGDPSTGDHHVHLCFDSASCDAEYTLVYGNEFMVTGLAPGEHTIEASLRNADHTPAGPTDEITVTVKPAGTAATGSSPSPAAGAAGTGSGSSSSMGDGTSAYGPGYGG